MSRMKAIARATDYFDKGTFKSELARRVAIPTESQNPERAAELARYVDTEMKPALEALGFSCRVLKHAKARGPFLYAERIEGTGLPTALSYGHGDVIRGLESGWKTGVEPWRLIETEGRYYGRGVADNKGQHTINLAALGAVLAERGRLGFNAKWLIEMGEETGSSGLRELVAENRDLFAADVLMASDGPRLSADRPTILLGGRGAYPIDLWIDAREGGHHSGNWGGLLSSPAIQLVHALASIAGPTGKVNIREWLPEKIPDSVRRALADCEVKSEPGEPEIDPNWERGRKSVRLVQLRDPGDDGGQSGEPGQCGAATRLGARATALRRRRRSRRRAAGAPPPPRSPRISDGADRARPRRDFRGDAHRSRPSVGPLGGCLNTAQHEQAPRRHP